MKIFHILIFSLLIGITTKTKAQKTILLFNQNDLKGWYAFQDGTGVHADPKEVFTVSDNMIRMYGKKAGYLMSNQSFKNFTLTVEFRWNLDTTVERKNDKKNSGVMYLVPQETPDELWPKGIQYQIKEGATGDFVFLQNTTLTINKVKTEPGKSVVSKYFKDAEKPFGQWNTLTVSSKNGKIKQKLNGKLVNKGCEASVSEGRILLQYEGFPVDFRKVEIKKLK